MAPRLSRAIVFRQTFATAATRVDRKPWFRAGVVDAHSIARSRPDPEDRVRPAAEGLVPHLWPDLPHGIQGVP